MQSKESRSKTLPKMCMKVKSKEMTWTSPKLEMPPHDENICLMHLAQKKEKKEIAPNKTPKTLMSSNTQQKSMRGKKP